MCFEITNDNMISIMIVFGLFHSPACYEIRRLIILMGVIEESKKPQPALEMHGIIVELSKCSLLQYILARTSKNLLVSVSSAFILSFHCPLGSV